MPRVRQFSLVAIAAGLLMTFSALYAQTPDPAKPTDPSDSNTEQAISPEWTGVLLDADCKSAAPDQKCPVTETTKNFGFQNSDGKYYKLDSDGNSKVATALEKVEDKTGDIRVSFRGTADGEVLKVDSVTIR